MPAEKIITIKKYMEWARSLRKWIKEHPDPRWAPLHDWDDEEIAEEMRRSGAKTSTQAGRHMSRIIRGVDE